MIVSHDLKLILIRIPCAGYGDIATNIAKLPDTEIVTHPVFGDHMKLSDVDFNLPDYKKVAFFRNPVNWVTESWYHLSVTGHDSDVWSIWGVEECSLRDFAKNCFMQTDWIATSGSDVSVYPIEDRDRIVRDWKIGIPSKWLDERNYDKPIEDEIFKIVGERLK